MQFSLAIWSVVACLALPAIDAQLPFIGVCPKIQEMQNFELDRFMGLGFEYASYPEFTELGTKCNSIEYKKEDNGLISAKYSFLNRLTGDFTNKTDFGKFVAPAQLQVESFEGQKPFKHFNFFVLGTDYDSFAVIYSCTQPLLFAHIKHVWIVTRSRNPSQESIDAARKILEDNNISTSFLVKADQKGCPTCDPVGKTA